MATIEILMATYNGEKYIRQQILSIMAQEFRDWKLIIHDDGSTDNTLSIINEFQKYDNRISIVKDNIRFGSPARNFIHLLRFSTAKRICFCDQDDIWFENKLSLLYKSFPVTSKPCALISDGYIYKTNTNEIIGKIDYKITNLKELLFINGGIHGSRSMINIEMRDEMLKYNSIMNMHDHLMSLIACSFGDIKYITTPLFLYRQHDNNVTGQMEVSLIKRIINGFSNLNSKYVVSHEIYKCNSEFLNAYRNKLCDKDIKLIKIYLSMKNQNIVMRISNLIINGFSIGYKGRFHLIIKTITRKFTN